MNYRRAFQVGGLIVWCVSARPCGAAVEIKGQRAATELFTAMQTHLVNLASVSDANGMLTQIGLLSQHAKGVVPTVDVLAARLVACGLVVPRVRREIEGVHGPIATQAFDHVHDMGFAGQHVYSRLVTMRQDLAPSGEDDWNKARVTLARFYQGGQALSVVQEPGVTIAVLGAAGHLADAVVGPLLARGYRIKGTRGNKAALPELQAKYGGPNFHAVRDNKEAVQDADLVVLSVRPKDWPGLREELTGAIGRSLLVSMMAGIPTRAIEVVGTGVPVVRMMPNKPVLVGAGAMGIAAGAHATDAHMQYVIDLFSPMGYIARVPESMMDAVTGLSGSGPGYVAFIIHALINAGVKAGLELPVATELALRTVHGTAHLLLTTGEDPIEFVNSVATPGGTTERGKAVLESRDLPGILEDAVVAAMKRAREISSQH